ncbi:MAG TPA: MarR family winged helix-turn-helix transcriptional regulator [Arenimonas sp.]|nr:MarR family winged helix-turn-helix transcriptional regulator [Arenimonas sp.]
MAADILDLEHFLPYRLSVLSNRISQDIARLYAERFELGITEWRVLAVLGRHPGLSAREVAERTAMDKVAVSRAIASLLDAGRLERETHAEDRRRSVLRLSRKGQAVYAQVAPLALRYQQNLLDTLDAEERRWLEHLLARMEERERASRES